MKDLTVANQTNYILLDPTELSPSFWETTRALSLATASKIAFPFSVVLGAIGIKYDSHYATISALFISGCIQYATTFSLSSALESQQDEAYEFRAALIDCRKTTPLPDLDKLQTCSRRVFGYFSPETEKALTICFLEKDIA